MGGIMGGMDQEGRSRDQEARKQDQEGRSRNQEARNQNQETSSQDQDALESDARIERMAQVAVLFGEITAATREFLRALAESDRHRDWEDEGFGSCAEWLAWRIGITRGTANEKVRAAGALEDLPLISEAMSKGELSFSKVRAITRVATPDNESELLEFALAGSAANLERLVRGWKTLSRFDEQEAERIRHSRRCFSVFPDEDGMYVVRGRLDPEVGAALMRAVEAASDALFTEASKNNNDGRHTEEAPESAQLRADAVGLIAERALAAGFGAGLGAGAGDGVGDQAPISGSRAERYQVVLHVEAATLAEEGRARPLRARGRHPNCRGNCPTAGVRREPGRGEPRRGQPGRGQPRRGRLNPGPGPMGSVLDVGRKTRTIPPALRRALDARDRGCRFPRVWAPLHRRPSHRALGGWRRNQAGQCSPSMSLASSQGA